MDYEAHQNLPSSSKEQIYVEIPCIRPEQVLPTEEMISQGMSNLLTVYNNFPKDITPEFQKLGYKELKNLLLERVYEPIRGCFMGFTAHASQFSGFLTISEAESFNAHLISSTQNNINAIIFPVSDDPEIANIYLVNLSAANRIINSYASVFPEESKKDPLGWIRQIQKSNDPLRYIYIGLLSGFPSDSVRQYTSNKSRSFGKISGIGHFISSNTENEKAHIIYANKHYALTGMDALVHKLKQENHVVDNSYSSDF